MRFGATARLRGLLQAVGAFRPFLRDVPIVRLRHDDKHVHLQEGYGGEPIDKFPPCRFFRLHVEGKVDQARTEYERWYREQFDRYGDVSKGKGGMHRGSLYREVVQEHVREGVQLDRDRPKFRNDLVNRAIVRRVQQRFELFRGIADLGYRADEADPVIGIRQGDGTIRLEGGAHRAAALRALDKDTLPSVLVLSPRARQVLQRLRVVK
jgi:hypothetical protein